MKHENKFFTWPRLIIVALIGAAMALDHFLASAIGTYGLAMSALAADRDTPEVEGKLYSYPILTGVKIYAGSIVVLDSSGWAKPAVTATGLIPVGRAEDQVDNTLGASGDLYITVREGIFRYANSADADEITKAQIGDTCFLVDDQTVAKTSDGGARSAAGYIRQVDSDGVWVQFKNTAGVDGDLVAANNLSDVANTATAASNLNYSAMSNIVASRKNVIAGGAEKTVAATEGDSLIQTATDNAVITLPDVAAGNKGLRVTVQNTGDDGAAKVSVSPHSSDKIIGSVMAVALSGVADKDAINTKATAIKGDYIVLESDGVDTWWVVGGQGVWASEG